MCEAPPVAFFLLERLGVKFGVVLGGGGGSGGDGAGAAAVLAVGATGGMRGVAAAAVPAGRVPPAASLLHRRLRGATGQTRRDGLQRPDVSGSNDEPKQRLGGGAASKFAGIF